MDAPGGSNGGREFPSDREEPRLGLGRSGRGLDASDMLAVSMGAHDPELIGAESSGSQADLGGAVIPAWNGGGTGTNAPERCKFLRSIGPDGKLSEAGHEAVPTHRCAAFGDPLPLSLRQQELVCLQRVHVSCPRYMRGTLLAEASAEEGEKPARAPMPWLTIAGLVLIGVVGLVAIAGMAGLLPGTGSGPAATPTEIAAVATPPPAETPTPNLTPTLEITASPSATTSPTPTLAPTPSPTPTSVPTPSWPPGATASRMNLLTPCVGQTNCWLYTVRSAAQNGSKVNDTIDGIARYFGVSVNSIYNMNPWAKAGIKPGDQLKIPNPTR